MAIVLTILKFIGIALLCLLGVVLVLLLLLLLLPICYRANVGYDKELVADGRFSFAGPLFHGCFQYDAEKGLCYSIKILWFQWKGNDSKEEVKEAVNEATKDIKEDVTDKVEKDFPAAEKAVQETSSLDSPKDSAKDSSNKEEVKTETMDKKSKAFKEKSKGCKDKSEEQQKGKTQKEPFVVRIKNKFNGLLQKLKEIYNNLKQVKRKAELLGKLWESEVTKTAILHGKSILRFTLRHMKPSKLNGSLTYGFSDPYYTGEILAFLGAIYPLTGPHLEVYPSFETPCFSCDVHIKGHLQLVFIAISALRIVTDKYIKKTYQRFQRITGGK